MRSPDPLVMSLFAAGLFVAAATAQQDPPEAVELPSKNDPTTGLRVTFTSNRNGSLNLWSCTLDGGDLRQLTTGGSDVGPAWSPDGRRLAFHSHRSGGWKIWVVEFDAEDRPGRPQRLTKGSGGSFRYEYFPCWSPDGAHVAFERWDDQRKRFELHVVDRDGGNERTIARGDGHDRQPSWSPDGSSLLFTSQRDGDAEVYAAPVDGDAPPRNLSRSPAVDFAAAWSPDGARILFHSDRDGEFATYTMAADGTDVRPLAGVRPADHLQGWTAEESNTGSIPYRTLRSTAGVWSPDGAQVLVTSIADGDEEVVLVTVADGARRVLTQDDARDFLPVFRPRPAAGR
ncbi:MAG: TolB family protein [Planctomycetota bacterium]